MGRLRGLGETGAQTAAAFDAVGASRPVELAELEGINAVIEAIEEWARALGAERRMLPDDASDPRGALYNHLHDRGFHD